MLSESDFTLHPKCEGTLLGENRNQHIYSYKGRITKMTMAAARRYKKQYLANT